MYVNQVMFGYIYLCLCQPKVSKVPIPKALVEIDVTKVQSPLNTKGQMSHEDTLITFRYVG